VNRLAAEIDAAVAAVEPQLIAWRRDLHAHPSSATARSAPPRSSPPT
jgi:hypothetical protein